MKHIMLRKIQGTVRVSIPPEYAKQHGLQPGDVAVWIEEADGVRLRFVKIGDALKQQEQQEAAAA